MAPSGGVGRGSIPRTGFFLQMRLGVHAPIFCSLLFPSVKRPVSLFVSWEQQRVSFSGKNIPIQVEHTVLSKNKKKILESFGKEK